MIPARVKVMDGLLIEPHLLERNKERRREPVAELMESKEGVEDISRGSIISVTSSVEQKDANLDLSNTINFEETLPSYETSISDTQIEELNVNFNNYEATLTDTTITEISGSKIGLDTLISDAAVSQSKQLEVDVLNSEIIGFDPDGLQKMDLD